MLKTFGSAVERWKHGLALAIVVGLLIATSALMVGAVLAALAEMLSKPGLAHWSNIGIGTALLSLPYMLTNDAVASILREMLNPKLRD